MNLVANQLARSELRSAGAPIERAAPSHKHLAPTGQRRQNNDLLHFQVESAKFKGIKILAFMQMMHSPVNTFFAPLRLGD